MVATPMPNRTWTRQHWRQWHRDHRRHFDSTWDWFLAMNPLGYNRAQAAASLDLAGELRRAGRKFDNLRIEALAAAADYRAMAVGR